MKKLFKTNVFRKFFRPRYRIPNGIIKNKHKSHPPTIEEMEFIHEIISKKREERNNQIYKALNTKDREKL